MNDRCGLHASGPSIDGVSSPLLHFRETFVSASLRAALASLLLSPVACDSEQGGCTPGYETCACASEARCLDGLQCLSSRCVDPDFTPDMSETSDVAGEGAEEESAPGFDNEVACEALLDSLECTPPGGVALIDCAGLGASVCDLSDYFECLADNTACNGGQLDASGWTQCMDLAVCS